jgi:hypothetical protein
VDRLEHRESAVRLTSTSDDNREIGRALRLRDVRAQDAAGDQSHALPSRNRMSIQQHDLFGMGFYFAGNGARGHGGGNAPQIQPDYNDGSYEIGSRSCREWHF